MHLPHFYILTYKNFLLPKIPKMYDPILVTALNMQPPNSNPFMKMQLHPAAHPHWLNTPSYPWKNVIN